MRLRLAAGLHYAQMMLRADETHSLWERKAPAGVDEWNSYKRRLTRRGALWVRFGAIDAPGVVFGADAMPEGERPFRDADDVVTRLGEAIRAMPLVKTGERLRPISSCRSWTPKDEESDYTPMEWLNVGDPRALMERFATMGVKYWTHRCSVTDAMMRRTGRECLWDVRYEVDDANRAVIDSIIAKFRVKNASA